MHRRETIIALRARRQAVQIGRGVAYPRVRQPERALVVDAPPEEPPPPDPHHVAVMRLVVEATSTVVAGLLLFILFCWLFLM